MEALFSLGCQGAGLLRECLPPRRLVTVPPGDAFVLLSEAFPWLEKLSPSTIQQYKAMGACYCYCLPVAILMCSGYERTRMSHVRPPRYLTATHLNEYISLRHMYTCSMLFLFNVVLVQQSCSLTLTVFVPVVNRRLLFRGLYPLHQLICSRTEKGPCVVLCELSPSQVASSIPGDNTGNGIGNGNGDCGGGASPSQATGSTSASASASASVADASASAAAAGASASGAVAGGGGGAGQSLELVMCGWRGRGTLRLYMPRHERVHMLTLLGASEQLLARIRADKGALDGEGEEAVKEKATEEEDVEAEAVAKAERDSRQSSKRGSEMESRTSSRPGSRPYSPTSSTGAAAGSDDELAEQREQEIDAELDAAVAEPEPAKRSDDEDVK